jgi:fatty acid-binding protein DegV
MKELILSECPRAPEANITAMYGDNREETVAFADEIKQALGVDEIPISLLPSAILVHAGPKVIAVSFFVAE